MLANERTYAGWMRTGFASIAVGLGFQALFEMLKPPWVPKAIATTFLAIAIFVFFSAERRASAMTKRFHPHEVETFKLVNLRMITIAAVGATLALTAAIWVLGP